MERSIAAVRDGKAYVYSRDFLTNKWNNISSTNGTCKIIVFEKRKQCFIRIFTEDQYSNQYDYLIPPGIQVTKTENMLQIPVMAHNQEAKLLGVRFRDHIDEEQFMLAVSEKIDGFNLPYTMKPDLGGVPSYSRPKPGYIKPTLPNLTAPQQYIPGDVPYPGGMQQPNQQKDPNPHLVNLPQEKEYVPPKLPPSHRQHPTTVPNPPNPFVGEQDIRRFGDSGASPNARMDDHPQGQKKEDNFDINGQRRYKDELRHQRQQQPYQQQQNYQQQQHQQPLYPQQPYPQQHYNDQQNQPYKQQPPYLQQHYQQQDKPYQQQPQNGGFVGRNAPHKNDGFPLGPTPRKTVRKNEPNNPQLIVPHLERPQTLSTENDSEIRHYANELAHAISSRDMSAANSLLDLLMQMIPDGEEQASGLFSLTYQSEKVVQKKEEPFNLEIQIEQFNGKTNCIYLDVYSRYTIEDLKLECQKKLKLPKECQHVIVGDQLAEDKQTLAELEITSHGNTVYIYVQHSQKVKIPKPTMDKMKEQLGIPQQSPPVLRRSPLVPKKSVPPPAPGGISLEPPVIQPSQGFPPPAPGGISLEPLVIQPSQGFPPQPQPVEIDGLVQENNAVFRGRGPEPQQREIKPPHGGVHVMPVIHPGMIPQFNIQLPNQGEIMGGGDVNVMPPPSPPKQVGWECPSCTFLNKPYRPGCCMCDDPRPEGYKPPPDYVMDEEERKFVDQDEEAARMLQQFVEEDKQRNRKKALENYRNLIEADDVALVTNDVNFDCPVCFDDVQPGEGIRLKGCLHLVCKVCLHGTVMNTPDAEIKCPFADNDFECQEPISEREIRAVLSDEELDSVHRRGLRLAEAAAQNSFHCRSADCLGFCFFEDEVNEFRCDICGHVNCILCKAQHEDMNCKQYQDDLKIKAANDVAARQTQEMLENMVKQGEAMKCPHCSIIVTKKIGCDWIKCSMCKTEMCWATKGPRWGPKGRGDTSGGCKCGVNRQKCHPNCRNCH